MRGYFGIGVERISKEGNLGNLVRTAHGFGADFVFTVAADRRIRGFDTDTSRTADHTPFYQYERIEDLRLPEGCQLVGIELLDEATDLPSFQHPLRAAYILGPEKGVLSDAMRARCDHFIKIPTQFSLNVATAGAIVMYDRLRCLGRFADRPVTPGGTAWPRPEYRSGGRRPRSAKTEAAK